MNFMKKSAERRTGKSRKSQITKKAFACMAAGVMTVTSLAITPTKSNAAYKSETPNNYDNFAEALQYALCFYDANKCGDEVADDGYYSWRGNCHVKDASIPLKTMTPLPTGAGGGSNSIWSGKGNEPVATTTSSDNISVTTTTVSAQSEANTTTTKDDKGAYDGKGDGGASAAAGLYEGVNMSEKFINENRKYLDPDGDGCVNLTGGWHDAGDHVKFGLPMSYSGSTIGWGYYEYRDAYKQTGLAKHVEDELKWVNDYFMKATFLDDNGNVVAYCYQVGEGNNDHNYWCAPELQVDNTIVATSSCAVKRPAYFATYETPASDMCAGAAASLALNYLNFKDTDPEYAEKSLKYAKALYDFAVKTHIEMPGDNSFTVKSLGYDGGFYTSSYDYDELAWAAIWLYYCTKNYDYVNDIVGVDESVTTGGGTSGDAGADQGTTGGQSPSHPYTGYIKRIISDTGNCWQNIWVHCWDTVWGGVFSKLAPVTNTARDWYIARWQIEYWSGMNEKDAANADFEVPVTSHKYFGPDDHLWNTTITADKIKDLPTTDGAFLKKTPAGFAMLNDYGSARYDTAALLETLVYTKETGDDTFVKWAKEQMEYILGDNPMGYAYEVGYGNNYATHPHHRAASCSATQAMDNPDPEMHTLWGALVGGPDADDFHNDITSDYIYNEVTDDYNAAFCGALAGLYDYYGATGKELADKNYINKDFNMSENAAGYDKTPDGKDTEPTGVYVTAGKAQENDAGLQVKIVIHNRTVNPPQFLSDLKVRYYFNIDELTKIGEDASMVYTRVDYDAEAAMTDNKSAATISDPIQYKDNIYYVEIAWKNCNFYGSRVYQFGLLNKMNPTTYTTTWDSSNDYSYQDLVSFEDDNDAAAMTDKITAYNNGKLVWGTEPDGTSADDTDNPQTTTTTESQENITTTTTTTSTTSLPAVSIYGDVNCDKEVDVSDVVLLNKWLVKADTVTDQGLANADCLTDDGGVDSKDSSAILSALAGIVKLTDLPLTDIPTEK